MKSERRLRSRSPARHGLLRPTRPQPHPRFGSRTLSVRVTSEVRTWYARYTRYLYASRLTAIVPTRPEALCLPVT